MKLFKIQKEVKRRDVWLQRMHLNEVCVWIKVENIDLCSMHCLAGIISTYIQ